MTRALLVSLASLAAVTAALGLFACEDTDPSTTSSSASGTGGSGGCAVGPQPLFTLTLTADEGPLPPDTKILVTWSAGEEPAFLLDDKTTWKTLDDGVNFVCEVDASKPPPTDLEELVCKLWTSGATKVQVEAMGFLDHEETFTPELSEPCGGPIPSAVAVELLPDADAGAR